MTTGSRATRADRAKTTIVIADDHTVVRQGLRLLIDADDTLQVIAEAGTVPDAERLRGRTARTCSCSISTWAASPGSTPSRACASRSPDTAIVVLTMQDDPGFARQALQAGALGLRAQGGRRRGAAGGDPRSRPTGENYLNPRLGARLATRPRSPPARPTTSPSASSRSCA